MEKEYQSSDMLSSSEVQENLRGSGTEKSVRRFKANPNFLLREIAGEAVLIPVGEAGIFENSVISLNESCSFLWRLFQTPRTVEEAVAEARKEYSDPDGVLEQGVYQFIKEYLQYDLLREEEK